MRIIPVAKQGAVSPSVQSVMTRLIGAAPFAHLPVAGAIGGVGALAAFGLLEWK